MSENITMAPNPKNVTTEKKPDAVQAEIQRLREMLEAEKARADAAEAKLAERPAKKFGSRDLAKMLVGDQTLTVDKLVAAAKDHGLELKPITVRVLRANVLNVIDEMKAVGWRRQS